MRILGISCAVPKNRIHFSSYFSTFGQETIEKIVRNIGVQERRQICGDSCTSDLVIAAAEQLFTATGVDKDTIDAVLFVTQTPDYLMPATSGIIQHRLELRRDIITMDVNHGCSGYVDGLILAQGLLKGLGLQRVLLLAGDTLTKTTNPNDPGTMLLFGDAGSATLLEQSDAPFIYVVGRDGAGAMLLHQKIGYRNGLDVKNNMPNQDHLFFQMNGLKVYGFTLDCVPKMTTQLLNISHWTIDSTNYFIYHQANVYMLKQLARKSKIPMDKVPISMDLFGNSASATIPLTIVSQLKNKIFSGSKLVLIAFGVGLAWASTTIEWENGVICPLVEIDC